MKENIITEDKKKQLIGSVAIEMLENFQAIQKNDMVASFIKQSKMKKYKANATNLFNVTLISILGAACLSNDNIGILGATISTAAFVINGMAVFDNTKKVVLQNDLLKDSEYSTVLIADKIKEAFKNNKYDQVYNFLNYFFDKDKINEIEAKAVEKAKKPKL